MSVGDEGVQKRMRDGKNEYRAVVRMRSTVRPDVRIQKSGKWTPVLSKAKNDRRILLQIVQRAIFQEEGKGCLWGTLVEEFDLTMRSGSDFGRSIEQSTCEDYISALRNHTVRWFNTPADSINRSDVKQVMADIEAKGLSSSRMKKVRMAINALYDWGIDSGRIKNVQTSPAIGMKVGRQIEKHPKILTTMECKLFFEKAEEFEHPWYPVWVVAILTGMRSGELHALTWDCVDFEKNQIVVKKSFNKRKNEVKAPKNGCWRTVPINDDLCKVLVMLKATDPHRIHVLPRFIAWDRGEQARVLRQFLIGIGLTSIKFHDLRSCFATFLIRNGVPPIMVMKMGGWKDLKTMQRYIRLAGIEIEGGTDTLNLLPTRVSKGKVFDIYGPRVATCGHEAM